MFCAWKRPSFHLAFTEVQYFFWKSTDAYRKTGNPRVFDAYKKRSVIVGTSTVFWNAKGHYRTVADIVKNMVMFFVRSGWNHYISRTLFDGFLTHLPIWSCLKNMNKNDFMDVFIMQKSSYMTERFPFSGKSGWTFFSIRKWCILVRDECIKIELEYNIQQFYPTGPQNSISPPVKQLN